MAHCINFLNIIGGIETMLITGCKSCYTQRRRQIKGLNRRQGHFLFFYCCQVEGTHVMLSTEFENDKIIIINGLFKKCVSL